MEAMRPEIRGRRAAVLAAALLMGACQGAWGLDPGTRNPGAGAGSDSLLAEALGRIEGSPLTLEEAVQQALTGSTLLEQARASLASARGSLRRERGAFGPEVFGEARRSSDERASASPFAGASVLRNRETYGSGGVRVNLPTGTELSASLDTWRRSTNSAFSSLNPEWTSEGVLSLRQPLLSGFGPAASADLRNARLSHEAEQARYEDAEYALRAEVETAYWDLHAAERNYAVQTVVLDHARALLREAELRARAGVVGPNQVANARVFLAEQEQALLDREDAMDAASDRLASLLGMRPRGGSPRFRPVDTPNADAPDIGEEALVDLALRNNRFLAGFDLEVQAAAALHRGARWDALPGLDLIGSVGGNGLAGDPQEVIFGSDTLRTRISGDFGDTFDQVLHRDYPSWTVGVQLSVPIGWNADAGERDRLSAEVARARARREEAARGIADRVRAAHREMKNGRARLDAARTGVEASQEQVRIGIIEYRNGRGTAFELVRLGADLAAAQQRYSLALVRTARAIADLRSLTAGAFPADAR